MTTELRIMTFNIWVDGVRGGEPISQTAEVIKAAKADVVGMQEVFHSSGQIAELLGFHQIRLGRDIAILSRFEIGVVLPKESGVELKLEGGRSIFVCSVHLAHAPYQPYQLLKIPYGDHPFLDTEEQAIASAEEARAHQVAIILQDLKELPPQIPVFITGDFNEPSHLDWTDRAAREGRYPMKVSYPTVRMLEQAGFVDSFRRLYPDEIEAPGFSWPTVETAQETECEDRIDFILYKGEQVEAKSAVIVGGQPAYAGIVVTPYPSDHRAVVTTFTLP